VSVCSCGKLYLRHKRSIDTNRHVCSRCQGRLLFLGKFSRDGRLIGGGAAGAAAGSSATPGGGGGGNAFTVYVKTHFAAIKRGLPTGTPHKEVMTRLAAQYKEQKLAGAAKTPAAAAAAAAAHPQRTVMVATEVVTLETHAVQGTAGVAEARPMASAAASLGLMGNPGAAASPARSSSSGTDDGWQTADEEVEEQTSSLLPFMDRLALC